jgi:hypothetical protein
LPPESSPPPPSSSSSSSRPSTPDLLLLPSPPPPLLHPLQIKHGMPSITSVEVCYGTDHGTEGYHSLQLDPHAVDEQVTLRWLLEGEKAPEVLTESQVQQREIERQVRSFVGWWC